MDFFIFSVSDFHLKCVGSFVIGGILSGLFGLACYYATRFILIGIMLIKLLFFNKPKPLRFGEWTLFSHQNPFIYGKYEVYRAGCNKQHYENWNNTGWSYNHSDITHWREIVSPNYFKS